MSETPASTLSTPLALAGRVKGYIAALATFATGCLIPQDLTGNRRPDHEMEYGALQSLRTHIQRLEYVLRCYILWLTAQMIRRARQDARFAARLRADRPKTAPPKAQPTGLVHHQAAELRRLLADRPSAGSFEVLPVFPDPSRRRSFRTQADPRLTDPICLVDARPVLARIARLPRILKRADLYAARLASRMMAETERVRQNALSETLRTGAGAPLYFRPFSHWLPPEPLWASATDEAERSDLNLLHHLASSALFRLGHGPPDETGAGLPDLSVLDPPPPPRITLLRHP